MNLPKINKLPIPNFPIVYAMPPKAPTGLSFITICKILNKALLMTPNVLIIPSLPFLIIIKPTAKKILKNKI